MDDMEKGTGSKSVNSIKLVVRLLLIGIFLGGGYFIANHMIKSRKKPDHGKPPAPRLSVEAVRLATSDFQLQITSHGTVTPGVEGTLIPEVAGRIVEISPNLIDGGSFQQDEVLVRIEERDYRLSIPGAEAKVAQARLALSEEEARSAQALRDWQRFHKDEPGDDLALRKPQLAKAQADVVAAEAVLDQAGLNLARTAITAPYNGKVLSKNVSIGQYVGPGTVLAKIYGVDYFEVKIPLNDQQLRHVTIPQLGDATSATEKSRQVTLLADAGNGQHQYPAVLVRSQGVVDTKSRQVYVVARVENSSLAQNGIPPLEPGRFVEARLSGETMHDVFVLPRSAVKEGNLILMVDSDNTLRQRPVTVIYSDKDRAVVKEGLSVGELLCVSSVVFDGKPVKVEVRVLGEEAEGQPAESPESAESKNGKQKSQGLKGAQGSKGPKSPAGQLAAPRSTP